METHNTREVEEKDIIKFVIDIVWEATDGGVKMAPNQFSHFEEPLGALTDFQTYLHHQLQKAREEERERIKGLFPKLNPNSDSWGTNQMDRILKAIDKS